MGSIAIVETQKRTRERIATFLREEGYATVAFDNGADALKALESSDADIDLLIAAWDLIGEISSAELLMRLKQRRETLPVIVIALAVRLGVSSRVFDLGASDLLQKPIDGKRLCKAVRQALQDPREVDPLVAELREELVGDSRVFLDAVVKLAQAIRSKDTNVLLVGESGVGKEVFAQLIHKKSQPEGTPIVAANIAGYSETLIESELFGHEKGAFTDAKEERQGAFERAGKGTLFLDEIGYLGLSLQPKLLRAIAECHFYRVGGNNEMDFEARLICATSRNLARATIDRTFRNDLYYRISEFEIRIPSLRERKEDIRLLTEHFLKDIGIRLEREALAVLESYSFPGNVRELKSVLNHAKAVCSDDVILPDHLPHRVMRERESRLEEHSGNNVEHEGSKSVVVSQYSWPGSLFTMTHEDAIGEITRQFDKTYLPHLISEAGTQERAAEMMGTTPKTLRQWLKNCGLAGSKGKAEEHKS